MTNLYLHELVSAGAISDDDLVYLEQQTPPTSPTGLPAKLRFGDLRAAVTLGLFDYRGGYDASTNLFPAAGGSGPSGAVAKADVWSVTIAGTLGGLAVKPGDLVIAKVDAPGQASGNWVIEEHDVGYVPADDSLVVHKALTETVTGQKTFILRPITAEQAVYNSIPVDGTTDASTPLAALDATPNDVETLVISKGQTLYVNTNLTLANIELDVKNGGKIKVGTGFTFKAPIKNPGLRTILDVTGTPGVFVPTNQPLWHFVWWGPVNTSDDSATFRRAYAAAGPLAQVFSSLAASGQKYMLPFGISKVADVDCPSGCDVGGVFGGTLLGLASGTVAYGMKFDGWSGLHDTFVHSQNVTGKTVVWIDGNRCYARDLYCAGNVGATGIMLRSGHLSRTITDGVISGGTTLTSAAQAVFTTADTGKVVTGTGIPALTTMTYVSPTVVTLSAVSTNGAVASILLAGSTQSLSNKVTNLWLIGGAAGTGLSVECSDFEWSNVMSATYGNNIDLHFGAVIGNGTHTWGAAMNGLRAQGQHDVRLTNIYSESNGVSGVPGGTPTGWWGIDLTGSDRCVIDGYHILNNANGMKLSAGGTRTVADGVLNSTTTITSATAIFSAADVNLPITGTGIPANTTILSYAADGLSAVLSAAATASASGVSLTMGTASLGACRNNVIGDGTIDDNVDTGLELDNSVATSVIGVMFGSLTNSAAGRRGLHAGRGCTATVRAKGSNLYYSQKLKVDDSQGGLDIELGRKRISAAEQGVADYTDQAVVFQTMCTFPVAFNDEWDLRARVVYAGSQGSDARLRIIPSALGTGADGRVGVISATNGSATSPTAASILSANVSRLNVTTPATLGPIGAMSVKQEQMVVLEGRYKAGSTPVTDNVNLNLQCASGTAQGNLRTITDGVISGTTTLTSATQAAFTIADVGRTVVGTGIPANTYISAFTSATQVTISAASTNGAVASIDIGPGQTTFIAADTIFEAVRRG